MFHVAAVGWQPASHLTGLQRPHAAVRIIAAEQSDIAAEYIRSSVDVTAAKAAVSAFLEEDVQRERTLDALFMRPPSIEGDAHDGEVAAHVWERDDLVGTISSSELLSLDETAGIWPMSLERDESVAQMAYVDEAECTGCTYCASIARSTFHMEEEARGVARAVQQGECADAIEEAMDACPANCIHLVSRLELNDLEEQRAEGHSCRLDHFSDQAACVSVAPQAARRSKAVAA